nr:DUF4160 domain-containing protein [Fibrobacter sp. UWH4]
MLTVFGLRFFFYSREHEPVHVHVESNEGLAKFEIQGGIVKLVDSKGMRLNELKLAESIVEENKEHFENEWVKYFKNLE